MSDNRRTHDEFHSDRRKDWSAPAIQKVGIEEITSTGTSNKAYDGPIKEKS